MKEVILSPALKLKFLKKGEEKELLFSITKITELIEGIYHIKVINSELISENPLLKLKAYYSVDSKAVDTYVKAMKELPEGIYEKERTKKISFSINNKLLEE